MLTGQGVTNRASSCLLPALFPLSPPLLHNVGTGPGKYIAQHALLAAFLLHQPMGGVNGEGQVEGGGRPLLFHSVSGGFSAVEGDYGLSRCVPAD